MPSNEDRFNKALQMLLDCVHLFTTQHVVNFKKYVEGKDMLWFKIDQDKIHNSSIRYQADNLEQWTRACKFLLT